MQRTKNESGTHLNIDKKIDDKARMAHGKKRNWIALTKPWCRKQERAGEQKKKDSSEVFLVYFRFSLVSLFSLFSAFHSLNFKMITWGKRKTSNNQNEMLSSKMENRTMDNNESKRWAHTHTHTYSYWEWKKYCNANAEHKMKWKSDVINSMRATHRHAHIQNMERT